MLYFVIHFKKQGKQRGFTAMSEAESEQHAIDKANNAAFASMYYPDFTTLKQVKKSRYEKWFNKRFRLQNKTSYKFNQFNRMSTAQSKSGQSEYKSGYDLYLIYHHGDKVFWLRLNGDLRIEWNPNEQTGGIYYKEYLLAGATSGEHAEAMMNKVVDFFYANINNLPIELPADFFKK